MCIRDSAKIVLVLHNTANASNDSAGLKRKLDKVPIMSEKRRKMFVEDFMCTSGVDCEEVRRRRRSVFDPLNLKVEDGCMETLLHVYSHFKTNDDTKESEDEIVVITPGAPPNVPENKVLKKVHRELAAHTPKLQAPKIGGIVLSPTDLIQRTKSKNAFGAYGDNDIVFTKEKKTAQVRRHMTVLGGDTFVNKWNVPVIQLAKLTRCTQAVYEAIFRDDSERPDVHDVGDSMAVQEELNDAAEKDERIPFPQEHSMLLGQELINVFDGEIVVLLKPGSGEMLKAALIRHAWGVGICKNSAHREHN